jgi:P27 family predicted phage terminase small subunit
LSRLGWRRLACLLRQAGLLKPSVEAWEAFRRSEVAQAIDVASDMPRVERWITYLDEWGRAMRALRKARLSTGSTGQLVLSPLAGYVRQLEVALAAAETELGMTPLARMKLGLAAGQARLTAQQLEDVFEARAEPGVPSLPGSHPVAASGSGDRRESLGGGLVDGLRRAGRGAKPAQSASRRPSLRCVPMG